MSETQLTPQPKVQMFGIVRDSQGKPRIDDPSTLHPVQKQMLTAEERAELGIVLTVEDYEVIKQMKGEVDEKQHQAVENCSG